MKPMKAELVPFGEGHLLVSEAGVFALAEEARKAEALGREAYALLALPVVPLVVGSYRQGYHQGVLHVASLEEHLQALPRVLSPEDVDRIAAFLKGEGERPEVRLACPPALPPEAVAPAAEQPSGPVPLRPRKPCPREAPSSPQGGGAVFVRERRTGCHREVVAPSAGEGPSPVPGTPWPPSPQGAAGFLLVPLLGSWPGFPPSSSSTPP